MWGGGKGVWQGWVVAGGCSCFGFSICGGREGGFSLLELEGERLWISISRTPLWILALEFSSWNDVQSSHLHWVLLKQDRLYLCTETPKIAQKTPKLSPLMAGLAEG